MRAYRLGKRGERVAQSRRRVVAAVRRLLGRRGYHRLSLASVAEAAGITRATVYNQFRSKRGILEAVLEDVGQRIEFARVDDAMNDVDPRRALRRTVAEYSRAWTRDRKVIRRVVGLAAVDPELAALVEHYEAMRRESLRALAGRFQHAALLRPGVSLAEAQMVLSVLTNFTVYDQLTVEGMDERSVERALTRLMNAVVDLDGNETRV